MGGRGGTHVVSEDFMHLMSDITVEDIQQMTDRFYKKAFQDETLDTFLRSHTDPHGSRFAKWIHQKLSSSTIWDDDRASRNKDSVRLARGHSYVVHDRSSAHVAAWNSVKRPPKEVGRNF